MEILDSDKDDETEQNDEKDNRQQDNQNEWEYIEPNEIPVPPAPTSEEWIKHQITHMPYKPWCPIRVKNAATNIPHRMAHHSRGVAMFSMDYMFMTQNQMRKTSCIQSL